MPHLYIEYTDNLNVDIRDVMHVAKQSLLSFPDVIPVGGLRIRAVKYRDYVIADGEADDAFIHLVLKLGAGRGDEEKDKVTQHLFDTLSDYLDAIFDSRGIALSLELHEFTHPTLKRNNIHKRFK